MEQHENGGAAEPEKKPATIHVSNLPFKMEEQEIKEIFNKVGTSLLFSVCNILQLQLGEIKEVRLVKALKNEKMVSMGYAFVEFTDPAAADAATTIDPPVVGDPGRTLKITKATTLPDTSKNFIPPPSNATRAPQRREALTLFASSLPYTCNEEQILEAMGPLRAKVHEVRLARDKERGGKCKGFGYIEFADEEAMEQALKLEKVTIDKREIKLAPSAPPGGKSGPKGKGRGKPPADSISPHESQTQAQPEGTRKPRYSCMTFYISSNSRVKNECGVSAKSAEGKDNDTSIFHNHHFCRT